MESAR
jgi:hypothetical protein